MSIRSIYQIAFSHCRASNVLENTLNQHVDISNFIGCNFEETFSRIYYIFKDIKNLGMLASVDVTLDILNYYGINDPRKFIVGSGDINGIRKFSLQGFVNKITISGVTLSYIDKVYLDAIFN